MSVMAANILSPDQAPAAPLPVCARALGKSLDERPILQGITLEIAQGEFVALLGANGAGKSTLLKTLSTLITPSSGTLELFGHSPRHHAAKIRARLGLIGHQLMLYGDLTAHENLVFFGRLFGVKNAAERARSLLATLGLEKRADDAVKTFSRGMAQRVSIARALMPDPELLLADEPFAGLDAPSTDMLERVLAELHAAGKTIILANHDIRQSLRLAGRAIVLRKGRKVIDDAASTLDVETVLHQMSGGA